MRLRLLALTAVLLLAGCGGEDEIGPISASGDYRDRMREFVTALAAHARSLDGSFLIIPQNGQDFKVRSAGPGVAGHNLWWRRFVLEPDS